MKWFFAKLEKGENYPDTIYWPEGITAVIPLSESLLSRQSSCPAKKSLQLLWKKQGSGDLHPLAWVSDTGQQECALDVHSWIGNLKKESYRAEHKKPLSAMLPFHYHYIPGAIRNSIFSAINMLKSEAGSGRNAFPASSLNCGCEIVLGVCNARWNSGVELPVVVLTHDIDTEDGFHWIEEIAEIEEKLGFRSSWNVVPMRYRINKNILNRLLASGHEIGLHGLWHNNKEAFLSRERMKKEFNGVRYFMDEFSIKGYRSPCWYRTNTMFSVLSEFFSYDLSCLDNDLSIAGNGGVCFMRPYTTDYGLVELPCTLPFEAPLFEKIPPEDLVGYWMPKINFIQASEGMLLVNTHPDPNYTGNERMLASYEHLLGTLSGQNWRARLPIEIVREIKGSPRT